VSTAFFQNLTKLIASGSLRTLTDLDLSNTKMGDANAKSFLTALIIPSPSYLSKRNTYTIKSSEGDESYCPIENLSIARNCLGFKTGAFIMNLLIDPEVKQYSRLLAIDLSYNTISLLVQNSVKKLLTETQYAMSHN